MKGMELLRKKIDESGYKMTFIAEKCGLSYQWFLNKLNGKVEFKVNEINVLVGLLNLKGSERDEIFFA